MSNSSKNSGFAPEDPSNAASPRESGSCNEALTESQRRMIELIDRHEKVLAFNRKLEEAIAQKNYAVIDECIAESKNSDYMAEHRRYMAELRKNLDATMNAV